MRPPAGEADRNASSRSDRFRGPSSAAVFFEFGNRICVTTLSRIEPPARLSAMWLTLCVSITTTTFFLRIVSIQSLRRA